MPEPRGKLDATGEGAGRDLGRGRFPEAGVKGPEGEVLDWHRIDCALREGGVPRVRGPEGEFPDRHSIDWAVCEGRVRRLRQRIFKAAQDGGLKRVRNLQKLM